MMGFRHVVLIGCWAAMAPTLSGCSAKPSELAAGAAVVVAAGMIGQHVQQRRERDAAEAAEKADKKLNEDRNLCWRALSVGPRPTWDHTNSPGEVTEARRRGLTQERCAELTQRTPGDESQTESNVQIAETRKATDPKGSVASANDNDVALCLAALKPGADAVWDMVFGTFNVGKAMARGLTLEICAEITGRKWDGDSAESSAGGSDADKPTKSSTPGATWASPRIPVSENKHAVAVIVGNKNYGSSIPHVEYAHNDADAVKRFVVEWLGYRDGNVIDLRDATRAQLDSVFGTRDNHEGKLFDWIRPGESDVLVFYSGHGVPGAKDKRPYLLPVDGDPNRAELTGLPVDVLYENLRKIPAKSVTVLLDACFSGQSPNGMVIAAASGISISAKVSKAADNLVVLTAARGDQLASWDREARLGLFTRYVLEGLRGAADGSQYGNADGRVTLGEVAAFLDDEMTYQARRRYGRRQTAHVQGPEDQVMAITSE